MSSLGSLPRCAEASEVEKERKSLLGSDLGARRRRPFASKFPASAPESPKLQHVHYACICKSLVLKIPSNKCP